MNVSPASLKLHKRCEVPGWVTESRYVSSGEDGKWPIGQFYIWGDAFFKTEQWYVWYARQHTCKGNYLWENKSLIVLWLQRKKNQSQQHFKHRAEYYYLKDKIGRGQFPLPLMDGTEQWLKGFLFGRYKWTIKTINNGLEVAHASIDLFLPFLIKREFSNVGFWGVGKTWELGERANNKLNSFMENGAVSGIHTWSTSLVLIPNG